MNRKKVPQWLVDEIGERAIERALERIRDREEIERLASLTPEEVKRELRNAGISDETMDEAKREMRERMRAFREQPPQPPPTPPVEGPGE